MAAAPFYDVRAQVAPVASPAAPEGHFRRCRYRHARRRLAGLTDERKELLRWIYHRASKHFQDVQRDCRSRPPRRPGMRVRRDHRLARGAGSKSIRSTARWATSAHRTATRAVSPAAARLTETDEAACLLGIRSTHNLGRHDGPLVLDLELRAQIARLLPPDPGRHAAHLTHTGRARSTRSPRCRPRCARRLHAFQNAALPPGAVGRAGRGAGAR